jgi:predicted Zn-dependent protease
MKSLVRVQLTITILAVSLAGCATTDGRQFNLLSTEEETRLGAQLSTEITKEEKVFEDGAMQAYVDTIGERLARHAPRQDVTYEFTVIDAPDTVNAFALPGGHLYIYTGLMKLCANEAELASVMAHEIAHVAAHHHGEAMTRQYGLSILLNIALGDDPGAAAQLVAGLASKAGALKYSRFQENESDRLGMEMLFSGGYKPEAMVSFMEKLGASEGDGGRGMPAFLSSHPATPARVANLRSQTTNYPLDIRMDTPTYAERYEREVLAKLRQAASAASK